MRESISWIGNAFGAGMQFLVVETFIEWPGNKDVNSSNVARDLVELGLTGVQSRTFKSARKGAVNRLVGEPVFTS